MLHLLMILILPFPPRRGKQLATKKTGWFKGTTSPEIWLAGSWCTIFGSTVSLLSGRMHFLAVLGIGLLAYAMVANSLAPTLQFGLCAAAAVSGIAQRPRQIADDARAIATGAPAADTKKTD